MIKSSKPRKQRKHRMTAPLHERQHFLHSHIDKALRQKLNIKTNAVRIAKGDTVKLTAGAKRGTTGKVIGVALSNGRIMIDSLVRKNARGKERSIQVSASNVYITDLNLEDKIRAKKLGLQVQKRKEEAPKAKPKSVDTSAQVKPQAKQEAEKKDAAADKEKPVATAVEAAVPSTETK